MASSDLLSGKKVLVFVLVWIRVARWHILKTKNPYFGKFWRVLQWKMLVYFMAIWSILRPFGIFYVVTWYFFPFWYVLPIKIWQPMSG
jgi:hypothetical protein